MVVFRVLREKAEQDEFIDFEVVEQNGRIELRAYEEEDGYKTILEINRNGTLRRNQYAQTPGIKTGKDGRIVIDEGGDKS
jgi:hypothetical protein